MPRLREEELFSCTVVRDENVFGNVGRVRCSDHSHEALQFSSDAQNHVPDTASLLRRQPEENRSTKTHKRSAIGKSLQDIAPPPESAVHRRLPASLSPCATFMRPLSTMAGMVMVMADMTTGEEGLKAALHAAKSCDNS